MAEVWNMRAHRLRRPWWGLGLLGRYLEFEAEYDGPEETVLANLAELQAEFPKWQFELTRAET